MTAFGSVFMPEMAISWFDGAGWSDPEIVASDSLTLHPGAHVFHYSSTCFEGLKAFRHPDNSIKIFRMDNDGLVYRIDQVIINGPSDGIINC